MDLEGGHIKSVIVLGSGHLLGLFGRERDTVINWDQIRKIGQDVILVELQPSTAQTADS
ncbi:MAG TPA: hypothetical protein DD856_05000 [Sulfobacillus sp.]|nr:hypothetical protein [Sulfobacillus sp.]